MVSAVAPGGHVAEAAGVNGGAAGVGVGVGAMVALGEAAGVCEGVGASVMFTVGVAAGEGRAVTAAIGEWPPLGLAPPPDPGRTPIIPAMAATPAQATSARPAMVRYGTPDRGALTTAAVADSSASNVPRMYRGQLTWTRWRQTSSCCRNESGSGSPNAAHRWVG